MLQTKCASDEKLYATDFAAIVNFELMLVFSMVPCKSVIEKKGLKRQKKGLKRQDK